MYPLFELTQEVLIRVGLCASSDHAIPSSSWSFQVYNKDINAWCRVGLGHCIKVDHGNNRIFLAASTVKRMMGLEDLLMQSSQSKISRAHHF